jgi:hypothetical protein
MISVVITVQQTLVSALPLLAFTRSVSLSSAPAVAITAAAIGSCYD